MYPCMSARSVSTGLRRGSIAFIAPDWRVSSRLAIAASKSSLLAKCLYGALCETPARRPTSRSVTAAGPPRSKSSAATATRMLRVSCAMRHRTPPRLTGSTTIGNWLTLSTLEVFFMPYRNPEPLSTFANRLAGRVTFVTGASSGIGAAAVRLFAAEGAVVVAAARRLDRIESLAAELRREGREVSAVACDVRDEVSVREALAYVVKRHGRLDCAFNNAGVGGGHK